MSRIFGSLFVMTGVFAIAGGLYTWGDGSIFAQHELIRVLIPWADILLTGPLSIVGGYAILRQHHWGDILGLFVSGIYVFGSTIVFIMMAWNRDGSLFLLIPALSGLLIGLGFTYWTLLRNRQPMQDTP